MSPVEQQGLCNRVAHALATNDGLSVGLPGPIRLPLMLQTVMFSDEHYNLPTLYMFITI